MTNDREVAGVRGRLNAPWPRWLHLWEHVGWPLLAAWAAHGGGWFATFAVLLFAVDVAVLGRSLFFEREITDTQRDLLDHFRREADRG